MHFIVRLTFLLCILLPALSDGTTIINLKGTPYDMGYQHGHLLKEKISRNIDRCVSPISDSEKAKPPIVEQFINAMPKVIPHIPQDLIDEMHGIADGSGIPFDSILLLNLFPEMFHCTGITVTGNATKNGKLYHVRVLDFASAKGLQDTAVLIVAKPDKGYPFVNVTYAGFIGSVTGMNQEKISLGEIGCKGFGYWDGMPMSFLLRQILQYTANIGEIKTMLESTPRTCAYYYLFSDGKTGDSFAAYATPYVLQYILPGERYLRFPPRPSDLASQTEAQNQLTCSQLPQCISITRGDNYDLLNDRLSTAYGQIDVNSLIEIIKRPVVLPTSLHNVIFAPETLDLWIAHAGPNQEPACDQPYTSYNLLELIKK